MTSTNDEAALEVAKDLSRDLNQSERLERLLKQLHRVVPCDASALMIWQDNMLRPVAVRGLPREVLGRRFSPTTQPRLAAILENQDVTVFATDDVRPDPYDGMLGSPDDPAGITIESCMGAPLTLNDNCLGLITVDAIGPDQFDAEVVERFRYFAAIAAAAVQIGHRLETLEHRAERGDTLAAGMAQEFSSDIIGESEEIGRLKSDIDIVAKSDLTVLITGETGTGKEIVARRVHARSNRARRPMIAVNCAAIPENMVESELFGHKRGAFTGATSDRMGKFELADGGTLFLDEIGELPISAQSMLLRVIQFGEVQRLGSDKLVRVDVRIIAATNRDLEKLTTAQQFRPDLYHRLSVFPIDVPPLRERYGDTELLAGYFLERHRVRLGTPPIRVATDAVERLKSYSWPGNVREFEHVLMRASLRAASGLPSGAEWITLHANDLMIESDWSSSDATNLSDATREFQRQMIHRALLKADYNFAEAARALDVDRSNLHRMADRLDLKP